MSLSSSGRLSVVISSNDWAYQSCTFLMEGISFNPSGNLPSSSTRWAKRIGSSSERNWEARKRVPFDRSQQEQQWSVTVRFTCRRLFAELDHLSQADACGRKSSIVAYGAHQLLRRLPRHVLRLCRRVGRQTKREVQSLFNSAVVNRLIIEAIRLLSFLFGLPICESSKRHQLQTLPHSQHLGVSKYLRENERKI